MSKVKCKAITWVNHNTPPLREIDLEESEAERLASLGYVKILSEKKKAGNRQTPLSASTQEALPVAVDEPPFSREA